MANDDRSDALVIGLGNEWRGDDGLGPEVARRIEALRLPSVRVLTVHQLVPELAEALSGVGRAFFVDAGAYPQLDPIAVKPLTADGADSLATHTCDPRSLLALSRILYGCAPRAWTITIEAAHFEHRGVVADQPSPNLGQPAVVIPCLPSLIRSIRSSGPRRSLSSGPAPRPAAWAAS
jgi:hydrogenase maturation protease